MVISETKNDIKHYKKDTIMLNNRILEFESLKDNIITVVVVIDNFKGKLKKNDLSKSTKN